MFKVTLIFLLAIFLLFGCVSVPSGSQKYAMSGAVMVVRLQNRLDPPATILVDVAAKSDGKVVSITGKRQQSVPGKYADYLIALALPLQEYTLDSLRDGSVPQNDSSGLLARLNVPIDIKSSEPVYLGRFVVSLAVFAENADFNIQDHFEEDTVTFRSALAPLRNASIGRDVITAQTLIKAKLTLQVDSLQNQLQLEANPIDEQAISFLTPQTRGAFTRFLAFRLPRAFAINDAGKAGLASGVGAVERAMKDCSNSVGGKTCRIFAVDNTYLTSIPCFPSKIANDSKLVAPRGCVEVKVKRP
jgi:hypothetical protein